MARPILEELAKELETLQKGSAEKGEVKDYKDLIAHSRNDGYSRALLISELVAAKLKYFADKVTARYYESKTAETKERIEASKRLIDMGKKQIESIQARNVELEKQIENDSKQI